MANEATYTNLLGPATPLTVEAIEKATREIEPIAAEIRRLDAEIAHHLGIHADHVKYLTGNWAVSPPPMLSGGFPLTSLTIDEVDRYPHTCPRCQGPAYVGAVEVDCAGNCK